MRILVTGCGRSGTQYTTRLFSTLGLRACHERVYNHETDPSAPFDAKRWGAWQAECSWLAVPHLHSIPDDVIVFHQLRDPRKIVRCWCNHHLLTGEYTAAHYIRKVLPECREGSDLERAVCYTLRWNELIERTKLQRRRVYRIEDLAAEKLRNHLYAAEMDFPLDVIEDAIRNTPTGIGSCHHSPDEGPTWEDILRVPLGRKLHDKAKQWGYV